MVDYVLECVAHNYPRKESLFWCRGSLGSCTSRREPDRAGITARLLSE